MKRQIFVITVSALALMLLCTVFFGCNIGDNSAESESKSESESISESESTLEQGGGEIPDGPCQHTSSSVNEKCEEICSSCGELLATEVHDEGALDDSCNRSCTRCGALITANDHAVKTIYCEDAENGLRTYISNCENCGLSCDFSVKLGETAPALVLTPVDIARLDSAVRIGGATVDDEGDFVTLTNYTAEPINKDGYFYLYRGDGSVTGRYMLIKYRTEYDGQWQIFVGANNGREESANSDGFYLEDQKTTVQGGIVADGEWRYTILDLASLKPASFKEETEGDNAGKYCADYIRWDIFDKASLREVKVDVAYVAMAEELGTLLAIDGMEDYTYCCEIKGGTAVARPLHTLSDNPWFSPSFIETKINNPEAAVLKIDETNGNMPYVQLTALLQGREQHTTLWNDAEFPIPQSGGYIGILYRRPSFADTFDVFINSNLDAAHRDSSKANNPTEASGAWELKIINVSQLNHTEKEAYYDPEIGISFLRFDYFNGDQNEGEIVDIAFVATFDSEDQAAAMLNLYYRKYFNDGVQICEHGSVVNVKYISDDSADTVLAIEQFDCLVCGQTGLTRPAAFGAALETVGGETKYSHDLALFKVDDCTVGVWQSGSRAYPTDGFVVPDGDGIIAANGWIGVNGNLSGAAYMVVDKDGNVLKGWTDVSGNFAGMNEAITNAVLDMGHGIDPIGCRFSIKADVNEFAGQTVNVIYAVIPEDIPEGSNDRYIPVIEIRGVSVPA